jgi:F0F1-type ATP synthase assembly protein I
MPGKPRKPSPEEKKALKAQKKAASKQRRQQIWQAFQMQRKEDSKLLPIMIGVFVGSIVVVTLIGWLLGLVWFFVPFGILIGALAAFSIFGRRVQKSIYVKADGQPGAAGWALDNMRGQWRITQGIAGTTHLDAVHRVIGRPGIIFVAEGAPHRVKTLLAQEKKRTARVAGSTPIYDVINEEGQVPLKGLQRHLMKLPRNISAAEMDSLEGKLNALGSRSAAMPKGPMPQGAKMRSIQRTVRRR